MSERPFLTAQWRHLLMLNYEIDRAILAPHVPPGTVLDLEAGRALVSIVAFRFERTRLCGLPIPFHTSFPEVNLRFYVRRDADDGSRRGVTFLRELVNRRAVAWTANWAYNERYRVAPIRSRLDLDAHGVVAGSNVEYAWTMYSREQRIAARRSGNWQPLGPTSHEAFIAEHYYGYGIARDGRTIEYRVHHPAWQWCDVSDLTFDVDVAAVYGKPFAEVLHQRPYSAFLCDGSSVTVYRPTFFRDAANPTDLAAADSPAADSPAAHVEMAALR
jgi:uncharacterized protein YqjF (DUF2071 family)